MPRGGFAMKLLMLNLQGPSSAPPAPGRTLGMYLCGHIVKFAKNKVF